MMEHHGVKARQPRMMAKDYITWNLALFCNLLEKPSVSYGMLCMFIRGTIYSISAARLNFPLRRLSAYRLAFTSKTIPAIDVDVEVDSYGWRYISSGSLSL